MSNQRTRHKNKKLSEDRVALLESIGFEWGQSLWSWDDRFLDLVKYKAQYGTASVPARYPPNPQLGAWVSKQRQRKMNLSEEQVRLLDSIGFEWLPARGRRQVTGNKEELPPSGPTSGYV